MKNKIITIAIATFSSFFGFSKAMACKEGAVNHSKRMIEAILEDVMKNYKLSGGGGISEIKMLSTNSYRITILQEEAPHVFTYELDTQANCKITISKKTESTGSGELKYADPETDIKFCLLPAYTAMKATEAESGKFPSSLKESGFMAGNECGHFNYKLESTHKTFKVMATDKENNKIVGSINEKKELTFYYLNIKKFQTYRPRAK